MKVGARDGTTISQHLNFIAVIWAPSLSFLFCKVATPARRANVFRMPKVQLQHGHFLPPSGDWEGAPPPRPMGPPLIDPRATGPNQSSRKAMTQGN